jgi:hypothetical protein
LFSVLKGQCHKIIVEVREEDALSLLREELGAKAAENKSLQVFFSVLEGQCHKMRVEVRH